jgi:hypothetical protein
MAIVAATTRSSDDKLYFGHYVGTGLVSLLAELEIEGTRPVLWHWFGPDAIPLEKQERTGVAGNDPEEWKRTVLATADGQLYLNGDYAFGAARDGSRYTKKGKGSIQKNVAATLQIVERKILIDRWLPETARIACLWMIQRRYIWTSAAFEIHRRKLATFAIALRHPQAEKLSSQSNGTRLSSHEASWNPASEMRAHSLESETGAGCGSGGLNSYPSTSGCRSTGRLKRSGLQSAN